MTTAFIAIPAGRGCLSRKRRRSRPSSGEIEQGDIMVVIGGGPSGTGMEETYQLTSALKHISWGKTVSLITDARFSGVSTGACFGHVAPEALAGGPIGKLRDNDVIEIAVDRLTLPAASTLSARRTSG
jgi:dihydroxyacid dehydratase/phosphogluconate dehydratase